VPSVKRQERGEKRRLEVLDATIRVLTKLGPRGVTHRAVAAEAGTSIRATTYYFSSRDELLTQALLHYADKAIERIEALKLPLPDSSDAALDVAAHMLALTVVSDLVDDRDGLVAEYELVLEIGRNPSLESVYRTWQARLEQMLIEYAQVFGASDPSGDARIILATLRGIEIEALARPSQEPDLQELTQLFRRLLHAVYASDRSQLAPTIN
jgi:DNA-binding transcriptional regulator YbjK